MNLVDNFKPKVLSVIIVLPIPKSEEEFMFSLA